MAKEGRSWFKRHKIIAGILGFFLLLIVIGIISSILDNVSNDLGTEEINEECKGYIDSQIPEKFVVKAIPLDTYEGYYRKYNFSFWNDGTPVRTCTENPETENLGSGASETKTCKYVIYKGTNPGENTNEYYIGRDVSEGYIPDHEDYYLEYIGEKEIDEEGNVKGTKKFRINVNEYTIEKEGSNKNALLPEGDIAYFYLEDYSILSCNL